MEGRWCRVLCAVTDSTMASAISTLATPATMPLRQENGSWTGINRDFPRLSGGLAN